MSLTLAYLPAPFVSVVMVRLLRCTGNGMSNIVTSPGPGIHRWRGTRSRDQSWAASRRVSSNAEMLGGKDQSINVEPRTMSKALIEQPKRLIYLSSGMHRGGDPDLSDLQWKRRRWNGSQAYSDSKLFDAVLALALARRWPAVRSNAVDPGWVATKMGGRGAPDDLGLGSETQAWLAVSQDSAAMVSGAYFYHKRRQDTHPAARDVTIQDGLLAACEELTGTPMPT